MPPVEWSSWLASFTPEEFAVLGKFYRFVRTNTTGLDSTHIWDQLAASSMLIILRDNSSQLR